MTLIVAGGAVTFIVMSIVGDETVRGQRIAIALAVLIIIPQILISNQVTTGSFPDDGELLAAIGISLFGTLGVATWAMRPLSEAKRLLLVGTMLVIAISEFSAIFTIQGICSDSDCAPSRIKHDWQSGLYFSIVTFTTTGYGDYHPQERDRLLAAAEALAGYVYFALFVSILASYFAKPPEKSDG